jgi:hypothetical protein
MISAVDQLDRSDKRAEVNVFTFPVYSTRILRATNTRGASVEGDGPKTFNAAREKLLRSLFFSRKRECTHGAIA